jgi:hypothetical protein
VHVHVLLDGTKVAEAGALNATAGPQVLPLEWSPAAPSRWLLEPGTDTPHSFTVSAEDTCGSGGGHASKHFIIESLSLDVIADR